MKSELRLKKTFPLNREELFKYFTTPELLEQWAYPNGLTLKVPRFNLSPNGQYRFEHTSPQGVFRCDGRFTDIVPQQKLEMIDDLITGPNGKTLYQNLKCTEIFQDANKGTEVEVIQEGFDTEEALNDCKRGWEQSFDHLRILIDQRLGSQLSI